MDQLLYRFNLKLGRIFAFSLVITLLAPVQGQARDETGAERVPLRLWNIPWKGSRYPVAIAARRVFDEFCKQHPHIDVRAVVPLRMEGPVSEGNEFLAVAGGVAPDVFSLYGRKIGDYHSQGFLLPLNDFLKREQARTGKLYEGISAPSPIWEVCHVDGGIVCIPDSYYSMALMSWPAVFARFNEPVAAPKNWEAFYRLAQRLTWLPDKEPDAKPGDNGVYGLELLDGATAGWHMLQYFWSSGGEVVQASIESGGQVVDVPAPMPNYESLHIAVSDSERYANRREALQVAMKKQGIAADYSMTDLKWNLVVNDQPGIEVLRFYRKLIHQPWVRIDGHEVDLTPQMLAEGVARCPQTGAELDLTTPAGKQRIYRGVVRLRSQHTSLDATERAMAIGTVKEVAGESVVILPFPSRLESIPPAAFIAGNYLGINATQKDPRIRDAAWEYIRFVTGPQAMRIRVATYVEHGVAQYVRPATLRALGYELALKQISAQQRQVWDQLHANPKVEPYCRGFQHIMTRELGMVMDAIVADIPDDNLTYQRNLQTLADDLCHRSNTMILGEMPQDVLEERARIGWIIIAVAAGLMAWLSVVTIRRIAHVNRVAIQEDQPIRNGSVYRRTLAIMFFLVPALGLTVLWGYYPLLRGSVMAFQDYRIVGDSEWVGLKHFVTTVGSARFWRYILQTFEYVAISLVLGFFSPIILAIMLHEVPRGKVLYRLLYYLPAVTTGLVTLFMWKHLLYDPSSTGVLNTVILCFSDLSAPLMILLKGGLMAALLFITWGLLGLGLRRDVQGLGRWLPLIAGIGVLACFVGSVWPDSIGQHPIRDAMAWFAEPWRLRPQQFLRDRHLAMFWLVIPTVWSGLGPGCLLYLAALKAVPEEQYEAADLDGAGVWSKCINVVVPNLSALMVINLVGAVIGAMHASQNIFVMTGGGPEDATVTVGLSVWFNAYMFLNFGLATAQAWVLGAMLIGFTLYQLRMLNRMQFKTAT